MRMRSGKHQLHSSTLDASDILGRGRMTQTETSIQEDL